ncbi:MAG: YeeE/YedE family protein [Bdellovibrionaceae bacterium]|nr:YeeE/YedE family protein [Pseudobdellovibrionaceae bacterium]
MKNNVGAFIVGLLFALGLGISGMTDPQKVLGFLDLFGAWDPSLAFVMLGAVGLHLISYRLIRRRQTPLFSAQWEVPPNSPLTPSLIAGAVIFGVGWGLAGYCPGPGITALASFELRPFVFVAGMILGMLVFKWVNLRFKFRR